MIFGRFVRIQTVEKNKTHLIILNNSQDMWVIQKTASNGMEMSSQNGKQKEKERQTIYVEQNGFKTQVIRKKTN